MPKKSKIARLLDKRLPEIHGSSSIGKFIDETGALIRDIADPLYQSWVFYDEARQVFYNSFVEGMDARARKSHHQLVRPDGWSSRILESNFSLYKSDVQSATTVNPEVLKTGVRTYAGFPVFSGPHPIAAVFVNSAEADAFSAETRDHIRTALAECGPGFRSLASGVAGDRRGKARQMLIVDDSPILRRFLRTHFEGEGFEVLEAGTVAEGLGILKESQAPLLLIDHELPDGSGLDLWRAAQAIACNRQHPVPAAVLLAPELTPELAQLAKNRGIRATLAKKKFKPPQLTAAIKEAEAWHASAVRFISEPAGAAS